MEHHPHSPPQYPLHSHERWPQCVLHLILEILPLTECQGVRGSSHFVAAPAQCIPVQIYIRLMTSQLMHNNIQCATAMASTFDTDLIQKVGGFLAAEAKVKSSVVLLAPTCNIQRSPLGGRAFESFSEDPHLSGNISSGAHKTILIGQVPWPLPM